MDNCRICGNSKNNVTHRAREMMMGTRDEFDYLECGACGTVQIVEFPDLSNYYPRDYYSFSADSKTYIEQKLRRRLTAPFVRDFLLTGRGWIGRFVFRKAAFFDELLPRSLRDPVLNLTKCSKILDVGCGNGTLLRNLSDFRFSALTGADPFIAADIELPRGVRIFKKSLADIDGRFDLVMLHHSFEHMPDPLDSLEKIRDLLAPGATCLIRIPIAAHAWEKYGVDWFQLDAPRHLFLFTDRAFRDLAARAGFEVVKAVYDSDLMQFVVSEQYSRDISMHDERAYRDDASKSIFTPEQIDAWRIEAEKLNAAGRGDQACFYLKLV